MGKIFLLMEWILKNTFKIIQLSLMKFKNYKIIFQQLGLKQIHKVLIKLTPLGQRKGFFTAHVSVKGGGLTSQAKAVRLAIARAASKMGVDEKTNLRAGNLLTTDARRK